MCDLTFLRWWLKIVVFIGCDAVWSGIYLPNFYMTFSISRIKGRLLYPKNGDSRLLKCLNTQGHISRCIRLVAGMLHFQKVFVASSWNYTEKVSGSWLSRTFCYRDRFIYCFAVPPVKLRNSTLIGAQPPSSKFLSIRPSPILKSTLYNERYWRIRMVCHRKKMVHYNPADQHRQYQSYDSSLDYTRRPN
jgi:hypothetical protein